MTAPAAATPAIRLVLSDVDGTLVTEDKVLTERTVAAVRALGAAGVRFAITSGRPPRGMAMLAGPLALDTPIAAFNGGVLVDPDMTVLEERVLPPAVVPEIASALRALGLDVWVYEGADWLVGDPEAPHVANEARTVRFSPRVVARVEDHAERVAKIVGVSDDHGAVAAAALDVCDRFGDHVTAAASQPYYLDVTHPDANKAHVARYLAARYGVAPEAMATIGDMPNDVLMFAHSGLSVAMGNADAQVKRAARRVTAANDDEGFAKAIERFVLGRAAPLGGAAS